VKGREHAKARETFLKVVRVMHEGLGVGRVGARSWHAFQVLVCPHVVCVCVCVCVCTYMNCVCVINVCLRVSNFTMYRATEREGGREGGRERRTGIGCRPLRCMRK
jgi:hypothetical protein